MANFAEPSGDGTTSMSGQHGVLNVYFSSSRSAHRVGDLLHYKRGGVLREVELSVVIGRDSGALPCPSDAPCSEDGG